MPSFFKNNKKKALFGAAALSGFYFYPGDAIIFSLIYLAYLLYNYSDRLIFYYGPPDVLSGLTHYIKMDTNLNETDRTRSLSILETGASFSFAMCYAAMNTQEKRQWWEAMLTAVANWDQKEESLSKNIDLPNSINPKLTLREIFEKVLSYIISNQSLALEVSARHEPNHRLLDIQADFEILDKQNKVRKITNIDRASGDLNEDNLADLLSASDQENTMCLVENMDQAVTVTTLGKSWLLYNPDFSHQTAESMHKIFSNKKDLIKEIIALLGNNLIITLYNIAGRETPSHMGNVFASTISSKGIKLLENDGLMLMVKDGYTANLEKVLAQSSHEEHAADKLLDILTKKNSADWTGFQLVLTNCPTLLPKILDTVENAQDISKKIALMLKLQNPNGWNGFQQVMVYAYASFPRLLQLASKNRSVAIADKAAFELGVNKELIMAEPHFSAAALSLYLDSFFNTDSTIYTGQSILLFNLSLYLILKNDTLSINDDLEKLIGLFKEGHCFALSACHAAMRAYGSLEWWESLLVAVANWDGNLDTLNKEVVLRGASNLTPVSLDTLFKKMIYYLHLHQGYQDYDPNAKSQLSQLIDGFEMIDTQGRVRKIADHYTVLGHFTPTQVTQLLDQDDFKDAMCIVCNPTHAITINYQDDNTWLIYDPNYFHKSKKYIHKCFKSKEELVTELTSILGHDLSISLLYTEKRSPPHMNRLYEEWLAKNSVALLNENGLYLVSSNIDLALKMLEHAKQDSLFPNKLLAILEHKSRKNTTFAHILQYAPTLLPVVLEIISTSNKAPKILLELLEYRSPDGIPGICVAIIHASEHLEKLLSLITSEKNAAEKIKKVLALKGSDGINTFNILDKPEYSHLKPIIENFINPPEPSLAVKLS